uniref:autotransporter outer membrane beta-barrel domain-containing protein n=1 Tax=Parasutterella excrementihominis TaxID=487175 RepID=UPI003FEF031D
FGSGTVNVNGGVFGILSSFDDNFTQKGLLNSLVGVARAPMQKANVVVNNGGTYAIVADQNVQVGSLTFNPGSHVAVISLTGNAFEKAYRGEDQVGTVTADSVKGFNENALVTPDYALVNHTVTLDGNTLTGVLSKGDKTLADYAANSNRTAVANALAADPILLAGLADATKSEVRKTLSSLANDIHVTSNAMTIANGQSLARAINDQAIGIDGAARVADVDGARARLWVSGLSNWSKMDRSGASKLKSDFYTGLIGLEADIDADNKIGMFFGAGKTKFKGGYDGKIDADDLHFGIYGQSKFEPVRLNYGFAYTHQDRDTNGALFYKDQAFRASPSYNAKLAQIFGEVAYTGLNFGSVSVEPYVGLSWMHLSADDFSNDFAGGKLRTKFDRQNLAVSHLGTRVKVPFDVGAAKFKAVADVNWTQYMGDTRGKSQLKFANGTSAKIESEKLSAVAAVGVGLEAQLGKRASLGVSYYGAYGSKIKSNGVGATFKLTF